MDSVRQLASFKKGLACSFHLAGQSLALGQVRVIDGPGDPVIGLTY
jgi:hypothetical protein